MSGNLYLYNLSPYGEQPAHPQTLTKLSKLYHEISYDHPWKLRVPSYWKSEKRDFLKFQHQVAQKGGTLTVHTTIDPKFLLRIARSPAGSVDGKKFQGWMGLDVGRGLLTRLSQISSLSSHVTNHPDRSDGPNEKDPLEAGNPGAGEEATRSLPGDSEISKIPSNPLRYTNLERELSDYIYQAFDSVMKEGRKGGSLDAFSAKFVCDSYPSNSISLSNVPLKPSWCSFNVTTAFQGRFLKPKNLTWTVSLDENWPKLRD